MRWASQITQSWPRAVTSSALPPSGLPPTLVPPTRVVVVCAPVRPILVCVHTDQGCRISRLASGSGCGRPGMPISGPRANFASAAWFTVCCVTAELRSASRADA